MSLSERRFDRKSYEKKLKYLRNLDNPQSIRFLQRVQDTAEREKLASEIPGFKRWWEANRNMPGGGRRGGLLHRATEGSYNIPSNEPESVIKAKEEALNLGREGLADMLKQLRTPYISPLTQQFEGMFGHLRNPILQGLLNPQHQNMPRGALFPDQIEREYQQYHQQNPYEQNYEPSGIQTLLSALGQHAFQQGAVPYLKGLKQEDLQNAYGYTEPYLNRAYEGAQDIYGRATSIPGRAYSDVSNLLNNLVGPVRDYADRGFNDIKDPQTFGEVANQIIGAGLQPIFHPLNLLGGIKKFGTSIYNDLTRER
jgi:hypothetical protein